VCCPEAAFLRRHDVRALSTMDFCDSYCLVLVSRWRFSSASPCSAYFTPFSPPHMLKPLSIRFFYKCVMTAPRRKRTRVRHVANSVASNITRIPDSSGRVTSFLRHRGIRRVSTIPFPQPTLDHALRCRFSRCPVPTHDDG